MIIRPAVANDVYAITDIYNDAVDNTVAIWTEEHTTPAARLDWLRALTDGSYPVLVAEVDGRVAGYASVGPFRTFPGYRHTAENSVYVHPDFHGRGLGSALLSTLIDACHDTTIHVIIAAIEAENTASIALHAKHGFESTGILHEVGTKWGRWLDLNFMTLTLPRQ